MSDLSIRTAIGQKALKKRGNEDSFLRFLFPLYQMTLTCIPTVVVILETMGTPPCLAGTKRHL